MTAPHDFFAILTTNSNYARSEKKVVNSYKKLYYLNNYKHTALKLLLYQFLDCTAESLRNNKLRSINKETIDLFYFK
jgi:RecB family exonuclease